MPTVYYLIRAVGEMGDGDHLLDLIRAAIGMAGRNNWPRRNLHLGRVDSDIIAAQFVPSVGAIGLLGVQEYVLGIQARAPPFASRANQAAQLWESPHTPEARCQLSEGD